MKRTNHCCGTKLLSDALTPHFHEALPRYLVLLILSFLRPMELTRFGQACRATRELAEEGKREGQKRKRGRGKERRSKLCLELLYFLLLYITTHHIFLDTLWISLCKEKDPSFKYEPSKNNKDSKIKESSPKKYLETLAAIWINPFDISPDPMLPADAFIPVRLSSFSISSLFLLSSFSLLSQRSPLRYPFLMFINSDRLRGWKERRHIHLNQIIFCTLML